MNRQNDIEQLLETWLDEGPTDTADAVFDAAVARVYRQRQRPAWRFLRRESTAVLTPIKLLLASAAILLVVVVSASLLGGRPAQVGGPPSPSPTPIASASPSTPALPSTSVSASAVFPSWYSGESNGAGILPAGGQTSKSFVPRFTFTVPEGWVNSGDEAGYYGLFPDTPANQAEFAASGDVAQAIHMGPQNDPYFVCDAWENNRGTTAAEIVAAMIANSVLAESEPVDVTIGGLTGKQIDVQLDPDRKGSCPGDPPTFDLGDVRTRAILLDSRDRGVIVIFVGSLHSAGHEEFLAEAMPVIESFQFDLGPQASPS
jgi:hypothetical protein